MFSADPRFLVVSSSVFGVLVVGGKQSAVLRVIVNKKKPSGVDYQMGEETS